MKPPVYTLPLQFQRYGISLHPSQSEKIKIKSKLHDQEHFIPFWIWQRESVHVAILVGVVHGACINPIHLTLTNQVAVRPSACDNSIIWIFVILKRANQILRFIGRLYGFTYSSSNTNPLNSINRSIYETLPKLA